MLGSTNDKVYLVAGYLRIPGMSGFDTFGTSVSTRSSSGSYTADTRSSSGSCTFLFFFPFLFRALFIFFVFSSYLVSSFLFSNFLESDVRMRSDRYHM